MSSRRRGRDATPPRAGSPSSSGWPVRWLPTGLGKKRFERTLQPRLKRSTRNAPRSRRGLAKASAMRRRWPINLTPPKPTRGPPKPHLPPSCPAKRPSPPSAGSPKPRLNRRAPMPSGSKPSCVGSTNRGPRSATAPPNAPLASRARHSQPKPPRSSPRPNARRSMPTATVRRRRSSATARRASLPRPAPRSPRPRPSARRSPMRLRSPARARCP